MKLLQIQLICARKVCTTRKFDRQTSITESIENIRDNVLLRYADAKDLTFTVDTNNTTCCFVICSDKDGFARDAVHVNANTGLKIVKMNETVFCDEEDNAVTRGNLHCDGEVVGGFGREEDIDRFLLKWRIIRIVINLDNMQLEK